MSKLVRDNIPDAIMRERRSVTIRKVWGEDYKQALKDKLNEEWEEVLEAIANGDKYEIVEELGDLVDVAKAYSGALDSEYERKWKKKNIDKGQFIEGYILEDCEDV